jgi:hypothetical protein
MAIALCEEVRDERLALDDPARLHASDDAVVALRYEP